MKRFTHPNAERVSPDIGTETLSWNIWKAYRDQLLIDEPQTFLVLNALKQVFAHLELRLVRHATFDQLSSAGYNIRIFDDGVVPLDPEKAASGNLPKNWKSAQPVVTPKIATLRNAVLFMDGTALLPDGRFCFFDTLCYPKRWRRLYQRYRRTLRFVGPATDSALIRRHLRKIKVPGRCFSARSVSSWNFGHFVHDILSRIYYEDLGAIVPGRDKVIAPRMFLPIQETLFRMVFEGYEIVQVSPDAALRVEELLLPANLCNSERFNPAAIAAMARRIRRFMAAYAGKERLKVCVSRRDGRRKRNSGEQSRGREFANIDAYETRMRDLGFDVVVVSGLRPEDQFALWANTTDIVGVHGAGMMNMIMMPPGGNYTEIAGASAIPDQSTPCPNWVIRCAIAAGHRVCGLSGNVDTLGRPVIDIERLEAVLSRGTS